MLRRKERQLEKHIKLRHFLFHAQGGVCFFCEQPFSMVRPATIEHLVPRSLGGTNERDNLALFQIRSVNQVPIGHASSCALMALHRSGINPRP
jgi:5-methylcytosine-specific restriction endonuclease McrA